MEETSSKIVIEINELDVGLVSGQLNSLGAFLRKLENNKDGTFVLEADLPQNNKAEFLDWLNNLKASSEQSLFCSFCGKSEEEVMRLFSNPGKSVFICDACIGETFLLIDRE